MYENPSGTRKNQSLSQSEHVKQLQMLLDVSRQVAALDTLDAVLDTLVSVAVAETKAERGTLFLHDATTGARRRYHREARDKSPSSRTKKSRNSCCL